MHWKPWLQSRVREWIFRPFRNYPALDVFERAVWTGDLSAFPENIRNFYLETGLLQLLALSGQHVGCLALIAGFALHRLFAPMLFFRRRTGRRIYRWVSLLLPFLCSLLLFLTSQGNPPVQRTLAMTAALLLLRCRYLECSPLQVTASSVALLIIINPALVVSAGFFLSAAATLLLCEILMSVERRAFALYLFTSLAMPLLVLPYTAFFFSKIALAAPLSTLLFTWVWELILIPAGFAAPFLFVALPQPLADFLLGSAERGWSAFLAMHHHFDSLRQGYVSLVRPTWIELAVVELLLLIVISGAKERLFPPSL